MPSEVSAFASDSERPPAERGAMERALDLARRGWGRVAPNPLVGAVVLAGDTVVGEGYHAEYGGPHAEVVALEAAGARARGATLVVNLEPCAHHGKTPPCTDARSEEHTSELQSHGLISYAVFCLKKKKNQPT